MAYHIKRDDRSVEGAVRRIATSQIETAIGEIDDHDTDLHDTVYRVRKRCKKLRGLIRLVRPHFDDYGDENAVFRDAASSVSRARDAQVMIETYDETTSHFAGRIDADAFGSIRKRLVSRRGEASHSTGHEERVARLRTIMVGAAERAANWSIGADGFEALGGGLAKTYKRARRAMQAAVADPSPDRLHEWRKRVKYHWYHARLLRDIWSKELQPHRDAANELADILGAHHDLAVLHRRLRETPEACGQPEDLELFAGLIMARQLALQDEAFALGRKLLAEKPSALRRRWCAYWDAWRQEPVSA